MQRIRADEPIEDFYSDLEEEPESEGRRLHDTLAAWASEDVIRELKQARPNRIPDLRRRAWECWVPLLNIADMAGEAWAKRARDAANALSGPKPDDDSDTDLELAVLAAIRAAFESQEADRLWTTDLLEALNASDEAPWSSWNDGDGLRSRELATKVRPYGIRSKKLRIEDKTRNGYERADFEDVFARYLPVRTSGTSGTSALESQESTVTQPEHDPDVPDNEDAISPHSKAVVPDVPVARVECGHEGAIWKLNGGPVRCGLCHPPAVPDVEWLAT
jgi:hypothetical protein